jgi:DNA-binding MarR family transcriptional regulator
MTTTTTTAARRAEAWLVGLQLARQTLAAWDAVARHAGVPAGAAPLLLALTLFPDRPRLGELAARVGVRPMTVTPSVGVLERHDWAVRVSDEQDRRVWRCVLTEAGEAAAERVWQAIARETEGL